MKLYEKEELDTMTAAAIFGLLPVLFVDGIAFAMGASWASMFGISVSAWTLGFVFGLGISKQ